MYGQTVQKKITGVVLDENSDPIVGATVFVKGSRTAASSDLKGEYSLTVKPDATITVTYLGYKEEAFAVSAARSKYVTKMTPSANELDEIIMIGYGGVKKRDLTGSVASVDMTDLLKAPTISFDAAIGGKITGVQVTTSDGQPGTVSDIVIRGNNSVTQSNSPLYVVDGFPMEDNDNNSINPADIASIEILKDASATAIYGARGANGVIIITTKRGKEGAAKIQYDGYYSLQKDYKRPEMMSPYEFVKLQSELDATFGAMYLDNLGRTLDDYKSIPAIDWQSMVMRDAPSINHSLSMSGGNKQTKYSASFSYVDQKGILINSGFSRYQGRMTLDQNVSNSVKIGLNANYAVKHEDGLEVGNGSYLFSVWAYRPVVANQSIDLVNLLEDPEIGSGPARTNPYIEIKNKQRDYYSRSLRADGFLSWAISKDLTLRTSLGISYINSENNIFNNSNTKAGSTIPGNTLGPHGSRTFSQNTTFSNENTLTFKKIFAKVNTLTALVGYTQQSNQSDAFGAQGSQIQNEDLGLDALDEAANFIITPATSSESALHSFLARAIYSYDSKYDLTFSARADGSSRFMQDTRWGYFYSGALAYRLSREKFIRDIKWIHDAKFRAGYGTTGNNNVGNYSYLSRMGFTGSSGSYDYSFGNAVPTMGGVVYSVGNNDLKWETTGQFNAGLDLSMLKGRISLTADFYNKITKDLLINADLPGSTGYPKAYRNVGKVQNSGLELSLNTVNITNKNFEWSTNFNISFNRNKVLALTDGQESMTTQVNNSLLAQYIAKVGQPIGMFYGVITDGLYQYEDFDKAADGTWVLKDNITSQSTKGNRSGVIPGYQKFVDQNGDYQITLEDMTIIGNPNPDFIGGFTNNFRYKGFDLNVFFTFSYGNDMLNMNRWYMENGSNISTNQYATYANRWTVDNTNTDIPRIRSNNNTSWISDRIIEDASYLRLKNITLGYSIPKSIAKSLYVSNLRLYVSAQNLWTLTNYSAQDPTVSVRNSAMTPGYDYSAYPVPRTYTLGASITF
ncbi:MAG: TonB-dependent receptor [Bacteroidales bacterium]|nr:TonB-dependent receptor [Bacteroidales bacterium]